MEAMCLHSSEKGFFDLAKNLVEFEGGVEGWLREEELRFGAERMRAWRNPQRSWRRMELWQSVWLKQADIRATALQATLERTWAELIGQVQLTHPQGELKASLVRVERVQQRLIATGQPVQAWMQQSVAKDAAEAYYLEALRIVLERQPRLVFLHDAVYLRDAQREMELRAARVTLTFAEDGSLQNFHAREEVHITQPGRNLSANEIYSGDALRTFILLGDARVQRPGQFELNAERLEVETEVGTLEAHAASPRQPLILDVQLAQPTRYQLSAAGLRQLSVLPQSVHESLRPLIGQRYLNEEAFRAALLATLGQEAAATHGEAILQAAQESE